MVRTYTPPDQHETQCPACGASIKAPPSLRNRRVQCPKCREVVVIESRTGKATAVAEAQPPVERQACEERGRISALEERVAALEAALLRILAGAAAGGAGTGEKKLLWGGTGPGRAPEFSAAQGEMLVHNLGTVAAQEIKIRCPSADPAARERADWFLAIFIRAGWAVRGPEEIAPENASRVLALAVPHLPVAEDAAKTYLALRATGFEPVPVLDSGAAQQEGGCALSLTIPPTRAAQGESGTLQPERAEARNEFTPA